MSDSGSFSSLSDLINNHLSKSSIQASGSENTADTIIRSAAVPISTTTRTASGTVSESCLLQSPSQRFIIPSLKLSDKGSVCNVLAQQISNTLRAKVKQRQIEQEQQNLVAEEQSKHRDDPSNEEDDCIIDLMQCLRFPNGPETVMPASPDMDEDNFEPIFIDCDIDEVPVKSPSPLLPCTTDLSYILNFKKSSKCSTGGKVICARLRELPGPYFRDKTKGKIVRFDFRTLSPDDIVKENLRKPYRNYTHKTSTSE